MHAPRRGRTPLLRLVHSESIEQKPPKRDALGLRARNWAGLGQARCAARLGPAHGHHMALSRDWAQGRLQGLRQHIGT